MATQTSRRRAVFVLVSGNPGGIYDWAKLVGYVERMEDEGMIKIRSRIEEKSDLCLSIDFSDDEYARKRYAELKVAGRGVFMGKLEIFSSASEADLAMKQMKERFPPIDYAYYICPVQSEE